MRRADFLFAFGDENEVHGHFFARAANGVKRGEERGFRAFLIDGAAAHDDFAEAGFIEQSRFKRRRRPFGGISLFDVVHEIEAEGFGRAGVKCGENTGLAVGGHFFDAAEAGFAEHLHHQVAAFVHAAIFSGDGGLANPPLQALYGFVVMLLNFGANCCEVVGMRLRPAGNG